MLIKCPECGKEISDKAEVCPSCGYPIASKKEKNIPVTEEKQDLKKEEHIQQEQDSASVEIKDTNVEESGEKRTGKKKIIIGAIALVACGCIAAVVLNTNKSDNTVHITSENWSYFETADGKEYDGILKTNSKKDLVAVTSDGDYLILKSGQDNNIKYGYHKDISDDSYNKITSLYEIKDTKDTDITIEIGDVKSDISEDMANLKTSVTSDSEKPFLLLYHYEDGDGNIQDVDALNNISNEMITEEETTITDTIWCIRKGSNTDFQFVIDGIIEFQMDEDIEAKFGEKSEDVNTYGEDSYYNISRPISLSAEQSGIAWATVTVDGKDEGLNYCRITDGSGKISWAKKGVTKVSNAPEVKFEMKYFAPSEYMTNDVIDVQNAEKRFPTLKEVKEQFIVTGLGIIELTEDEKCLSVDTNPFDMEEMNFSWVWDDIVDINKMLGLPDSLNEKLKTTRSIDGRQSESFDNVDVSWTYHPDNGLEVIYEAKN